MTRRERLGALHVVRFGEVSELIFQALRDEPPRAAEEADGDGAETEPIAAVDPASAAPAAEAPASADEPEVEEVALRLEVETGKGIIATFEIVPGQNVVGRSRRCEVTIRAPSISRRHALLTVERGRITVSDLGSRNHTYVGGEKVRGEVEIAVGAALKFGDVEAKLAG